ncbi:MAG: DUF3877 family protein [bacterium]|nr:DUF3877 family protein [bacterium]
MEHKLNFESLKKNVMDVIKESQMKLGYSRNAIGLYYQLDSLNCLLDADMDEADMKQALQEFAMFVREELGNISISESRARFCIRVPEEGVQYVHEKVEDSGFLREFIETMRGCGLNLERILRVFYHYSDKVICEKIENEEFDYLIYFEDGIPDEFWYCVKLEGGHAIYHRFTSKEYEKFGF